MKVYGPYTRKDGRQHIILVGEDKKKQTVSYPKFLMEEELGRQLKPNETIHHKDGDFTNNKLNNLMVINRSDHTSWDVRRVKKSKFICKWCGNEGERRAADLEHNKKLGKAGPFCSRQCAGKYGKAIQMNQIETMPVQAGCSVKEREYYNKAHMGGYTNWQSEST